MSVAPHAPAMRLQDDRISERPAGRSARILEKGCGLSKKRNKGTAEGLSVFW